MSAAQAAAARWVLAGRRRVIHVFRKEQTLDAHLLILRRSCQRELRRECGMSKSLWIALAILLGFVSSTISLAVIGSANKGKKPPAPARAATKVQNRAPGTAVTSSPLLSAQVAYGYRAFRIPAQQAIGAASFVHTGERVDVLGVFPASSGSLTRLLAPNVRVLKEERSAQSTKAEPMEIGRAHV